MHIIFIHIDKLRITAYTAKKDIWNAIKTKRNGILADGWIFKNQEGSHRHYVHPVKQGKDTIPFHSKELSMIVEKSIRKQAGLE